MTAVTVPLRSRSAATWAAGWYAGLPATGLGRRPVALELFGRALVAWRGADGAAAVLARRCSHQGADLSLGRVVDGALRCPFHHWRFDGAGACVEAAGAGRIPAESAVRGYAVVERHGLVWVWFGGPRPLYDVPDFPALDGALGPVRRYSFEYRTRVPPRRVLENAFDGAHFQFLHGLPQRRPPVLTWLGEQSETAVNGAPLAAEAWVGVRLDLPVHVPGALGRVVGERALSLIVDGWPGGQRLTFQLGERAIAKELLVVTPVREGVTLMQGWTVVPRGGLLGSPPVFWAYRRQHRLGTEQDLRIYRNAAPTDGSVNEPQDHAVLRFRKHYEGWVRRAQELGD